MTEIQIYDNGDVINIYATFTPTDPTLVQFELYRNDVLVKAYQWGVDPEVTRISEGYYQFQYAIPSAGKWRYKVIGTGTVQASETWFFISRS